MTGSFNCVSTMTLLAPLKRRRRKRKSQSTMLFKIPVCGPIGTKVNCGPIRAKVHCGPVKAKVHCGPVRVKMLAEVFAAKPSNRSSIFVPYGGSS